MRVAVAPPLARVSFPTQALAWFLAKDAADLQDANPVDAEHVYQSMLRNFPPKAIKWVRKIPWVGPVNVPLDRVDWDGEDSWAASHQQEKVSEFEDRIEDDKADVNPVVGVYVPGDDKLRIVDGHHRALAYRNEGEPVKTYCGFAPSDNADDPWFEAHSMQYHGGNSKANKQLLRSLTRGIIDDELMLKVHGDVWPVFGDWTASGKLKVRVADLMKVGPEGYIHGYICVRPPCGTYKQSNFVVNKGIVMHGDDASYRIGRMRKNDDGTYSMSHYAAADAKGVKLNAKFASRKEAAESVSLYHNVSVMHDEATAKGYDGVAVKLAQARDALAAGDYDAASAHLVSAELAANQAGDTSLATHAMDTRAAISTSAKPVNAPAEASGEDWAAHTAGQAEAPVTVPEVPAGMHDYNAPLGISTAGSPADVTAIHAAITEAQDYFKPGSYLHAQLKTAGDHALAGDFPAALNSIDMAVEKLEEQHDKYDNMPGVSTSVVDAKIAKVKAARDQVIAALGKPAVLSEELEPDEAAVAEALGSAVPVKPVISVNVKDIYGTAMSVLSSTTKTPAVSHALDEAQDALDHGDTEGALQNLAEAHVLASLFGDPKAGAILAVHNNLAGELGKDKLAEPDKAPSAPLPSKPGPSTPKITIDLAADQKLEHGLALTSLKSAASSVNDQDVFSKLSDARTSFKKNDIVAALNSLKEAYEIAVTHDHQSLAGEIAEEHDLLANDVGLPGKLVKPLAAVVAAGDKLLSYGHSDEVLADLNQAVGLVQDDEHEVALGYFKAAHDAALQNGETETAAKIKDLHDQVATAIGAPKLDVEPVTSTPKLPQPDEALEALAAKPESGPLSEFNHGLITVSEYYQATGKLPPNIITEHVASIDAVDGELHDGLIKDSLYNAKHDLLDGEEDPYLALVSLRQAYDDAVETGSSHVTSIKDVHNLLAVDLGAPEIKDVAAEEPATSLSPEQLPDTAPEPPAVPAKKLPKAAALAKTVAGLAKTLPPDFSDAAKSASAAVKSGDYQAAMTTLSSIHDDLTANGWPADEAEHAVVMAAHEALAEYLGTKPLQPRTVTHAAELSEKVSARLAAITDPAIHGTIDKGVLAGDIQLALKDGKAAEVVRQLRIASFMLKDEAKYAYGSKKTALTEAKKQVDGAVRDVEKLHDQDLSEKSALDRIDSLSPDVKATSLYGGKLLDQAKGNITAGKIDVAKAQVKAAADGLNGKYASPMQKALAADVKKLGDSLGDSLTEPVAKPAKTAPEEKLTAAHEGVIPSRPGDLTQIEANHYFATGERGSTASFPSYREVEYKRNVARGLVNEMSGVSTQDLAKVAAENKSYNHLSDEVTKAIAERGISAVKINPNADVDQPSLRYTLNTTDNKHAANVKKALDSLGSFPASSGVTSSSRTKLMLLDDASLKQNGMNFSDRKLIRALATGTTPIHMDKHGDYFPSEPSDPGDKLLTGPERHALATKILTDHYNQFTSGPAGASVKKVNDALAAIDGDPGLASGDTHFRLDEVLTDTAHAGAAISNEDKRFLEDAANPDKDYAWAKDSDTGKYRYMHKNNLAGLTQSSYHEVPQSEVAERVRDILKKHADNLQQVAGSQVISPEDERHLRAELVGSLVNLWAGSSNDSHAPALAVQQAAADEFGLTDSMPWKADPGLQSRIDKFYADNQGTLRSFVRAQYSRTQAELAKAGITSVTLHRGMRWSSKSSTPAWAKTSDGKMQAVGSVAEVKQSDWRPLSSWSHSTSEANNFYSGDGTGIQVKASVPASMILSTPRTGSGCLGEKEWVVLSNPGQVKVAKSRDNWY
jgi:hypothetical protein